MRSQNYLLTFQFETREKEQLSTAQKKQDVKPIQERENYNLNHMKEYIFGVF